MFGSERGVSKRLYTPLGELRPSSGDPWNVDQLWLLRMRKSWESCVKHKPNYFLNAPESLHTTAEVRGLVLGTGATIYREMQASIEAAEHELVIITCFWAASPSLESITQSLRRLSDRISSSGKPPVKVFIGFSSLSWPQKLFQTSAAKGRMYSRSEWVQKLGLPRATELPGLDITIKSIFVRPFSVMHPKFMIIDRKVAWLPSCNVSWETWFEGAVVISGSIVDQFVMLWKDFWLVGQQSDWSELDKHSTSVTEGEEDNLRVSVPIESHISLDIATKATFLPSPHHPYALCIPFWPSTSATAPPPTPLTNYLLTAIQLARRSVHIQTPNLTAFVVIHELLSACKNGVDVNITTSQRLMVLEQLVTAGTTTQRAVKWLIAQHRKLTQAAQEDPEAEGGIGRLRISYFKGPPGARDGDREAVQTHIKLTIVDEEVVVLGSQNMDRASWFTSQELGVAFHSREFAEHLRITLDTAMERKRVSVYDSADYFR
jgi:phosphatidylserine/phosphatidylglycerophosphate/cardiolipin synthase-like enzyme